MLWQRTILRSGLGVIVACLSLGSSPRAETFWMPGSALRQTFAGASIAGEYIDGRKFTESYAAGGSLSYSESARRHRWSGHWSIVRGRFCTIYDNFGTGGCFRVHQVSANCFEFYFDTRTEEEARQSTLRRPSWTARAWRTNHVSTCQERPMV